MGQTIRKEYTAAAKSDAIPAEAVTVYCTDYDRTVDTANSVLLGALSSADDKNADGAQLPKKCECRKGHGERSTPKCIAQCLQLGENAVPEHMPEVQVQQADSDFAMRQSALCEGWSQWDDKLEKSDVWRQAPEKELAGASLFSPDIQLFTCCCHCRRLADSCIFGCCLLRRRPVWRRPAASRQSVASTAVYMLVIAMSGLRLCSLIRAAARCSGVKQLVDSVTGGEHLVQDEDWPDIQCVKCLNRTDPDFNHIAFYESVRRFFQSPTCSKLCITHPAAGCRVGA